MKHPSLNCKHGRRKPSLNKGTSAFVETGWEVRFRPRRTPVGLPTAAQLANIELICDGTGLHWPDLDEDLSVLGIIEGRFGPS